MNLFSFFPGLRFALLLIFVGGAHFFVDMMLGIWPIYKSVAQLDMAIAGLIVAAGAFIGEGSQLFFGSFSDKGYRKILIISGLVMAMASSLLTYSSNYAILFCIYLITCLGSGSFHPSAASLMSSMAPAHRGLCMSIFAAGGSLGLAASQLTFSYAYAFFEEHMYLMALPAIGLALILACFCFPKIKSQGTNPHKASLKDFSDFFKNQTLRTLYISQIANQSIYWGMVFILPDALKTLGFSEWVCSGGGHCCLILGGVCMMIPGGYLADIYSERKVMLTAGIISFVLFYFILFSGGVSVPVVLTVLFFLGSALALMNPLAVSFGVKLEPNRSGSVSAFLMGLVWCISEALGPGGVGLMTSLFEDYAPIKALAVLGSLFLVQIYATAILPKEVDALYQPLVKIAHLG